MFFRKTIRSWLDGILATALVLLIVLYTLTYSVFSAPPHEDAAILMRYSSHLAQGYGIVWNVGERPVDGATDFLFMILLALFAKIGMSLETSVRFVGIASHILTVLIVYFAIIYLYRSTRWVALFSAAFLAIGPSLHYIEAYFGTPFFALFACLTWYLANKLLTDTDSHKRSLMFALSGLITGLIRPEGVFLATFILLGIIFAIGDLKKSRTIILYFALVFALLGGIYFFWRWSYFGHPLPNPFYKKGSGHLYETSLVASVRNTISLSFPFIWMYVYAALVALVYTISRLNNAYLRRLCLLSNCVGILTLMVSSLVFLLTFISGHRQVILGPYSFSCILLAGLLATVGASFFAVSRFAELWQDRRLKHFGHTHQLLPDTSDLYSTELTRRMIFSLTPIIGFTGIWVLLSNEMNYLMRFQYPVLPMVLISWPSLLSGFPREWNLPKMRDFGLRHKAIFISILVLLFSQLLIYQHTKYKNTHHQRDGRYDVALTLRKYGGRNYTIATTEAGLLPFYSRWRSIDTWGLNDPWIAHNGGITDAYLDRYKPQVIMFHAYFSPIAAPEPAKSEPWFNMVTTLKNYAERNGYILAAVFGASQFDTHYYYVRPGFPESEAIVKSIRTMDYYWYENGKKSFNWAI